MYVYCLFSSALKGLGSLRGMDAYYTNVVNILFFSVPRPRKWKDEIELRLGRGKILKIRPKIG